MRKQTRLVAVLSAAALLAIGASMTSFAATGWAEENGSWVYYDKNGDMVTDNWAKSGNRWFYLDSNGDMSVDTLIEDGSNYYYVGSDGAMVTNQWAALENENAGDEDEPDSNWYYFQASGKAYKAGSSAATSFKTINGKKYSFQDDGKMLYGWVNESSTRELSDTAWQNGEYFCGDENDGAMATGWARIAVIDADNDDGEDQNYWFYFNTSNGKKTVDNDAKGINGKKYSFDSYGVMRTEWASVVTPPVATEVNTYKYFSDAEEGWRLQKGWAKIVPQKDVNEDAYNDDSAKWFYAENNGDIVSNKLKTINGKKYAFNVKGEMLSGVWLVDATSAGKFNKAPIEVKNADVIDSIKAGDYSADFDAYYFGGSDDGAAKTGNQTIDIDGDNYTYSFSTTGGNKYQGLDGIYKSTSLYVKGLKIKADSDYKYQSFTSMGLDKNDAPVGGYLLNSSGSLMKSKKNLKDANEMYYSTDSKGVVTYYGKDKQK